VRINGFIWLEDIVDKLWRKHSVVEEEVAEVFRNGPHLRRAEKGHREGENLYAALGRTAEGRYLTVLFILKTDDRALIISARDMARHERKRYERSR